jgi:uncharacterized protein
MSWVNSMAIEMAEVTDAQLEKEQRLKLLIARYGSLAVAYSGGVDSTYLADIAHEILRDRAVMIHADSPSVPRSEVKEATDLAHSRGWNLQVIFTGEFENENYLKNDGTRCYFCRSELFSRMQAYAAEHEIAVMAYGAIMDDLLDPTRLGAKAAQERSVVAPLQAVDLSKVEIRQLSKRRGLPTWEKASFACLSSRFPVGTRVNLDDIAKVERAEEVLKALGFHQYRARHHGDLCRVEIESADFSRLEDKALRHELQRGIVAAGYRYVAVDLGGYRTGNAAT